MTQVTDVNVLFTRLTTLGDAVIYILVALAVVFIVYNIVIYFIKGDGSADRASAGLSIWWGIVGLFIIVSLWGLVNVLLGTFPTKNTIPDNVRFPNVNFVK